MPDAHAGLCAHTGRSYGQQAGFAVLPWQGGEGDVAPARAPGRASGLWGAGGYGGHGGQGGQGGAPGQAGQPGLPAAIASTWPQLSSNS
jgi:hypothetical protein